MTRGLATGTVTGMVTVTTTTSMSITTSTSTSTRSVGDHSAYETGGERVEVLERIFAENDRAADSNRATFDAAGAVWST